MRLGLGLGLTFSNGPGAPLLVSAIIPSAGTTLVLTYGQLLDTGSVPASGDFALTGAGASVSSVGVSGSAVTLTLSTAVGVGVGPITVSYTPGTNKIRNVTGVNASALVTQSVTNNSTADITAPLLSTAVVPSAGDTLVLTYNEALDTGSVPAAARFSLSGTTATIASTAIVGSAITLTLTGLILASETVTFNYTAAANPLQDIVGNDAANQSGHSVTNSSSQGDITAPTLSTAIITAGGTALELTYNEPLDTGSVPAVARFTLAGAVLSAITATGVSGSKVTLTLAPAVASTESGITISYTAAANPIQDLAGNDAGNLTTQAVTNSSAHAYDPRDEGNAVLWVDLDDSGNYTNVAGFITSINNKISAVAIPAITIGAPYEATGLNSKPCMHPTANTHGLSSTEAAVVAVGQNAHAYTLAWYGAYDAADPAGRQDYFSFGTGTANGTRLWGHNATGGGRQCSLSINDAATSVTNASGADNSLTSGHTVIWNSAGTTESCQVNDGTADPNAGANNPGTSTPTKFNINVRAGAAPSEVVIGKFSELWLFGVQLGSAARTRVYNYLNTKWA